MTVALFLFSLPLVSLFTVPCKAGHFSRTGLVPCYPCPRDYYQPDHGRSYCLSCPFYGTTTITGASSIQRCSSESAGLDILMFECQQSERLFKLFRSLVTNISQYKKDKVDTERKVTCIKGSKALQARTSVLLVLQLLSIPKIKTTLDVFSSTCFLSYCIFSGCYCQVLGRAFLLRRKVSLLHQKWRSVRTTKPAVRLVFMFPFIFPIFFLLKFFLL